MKVLTTGTWALKNYYSCSLPSQLLFKKEKFQDYYKDQNKNRTLDWQYQYGYVNMVTLFTSQKYLLKVSVAQASILLQYDEINQDVMTLGMLQDLTELSHNELKAALFHLCKPKVRLLVKQAKGPNFDDLTELIKLNPRFTNAAKRIVLLPQMVS